MAVSREVRAREKFGISRGSCLGWGPALSSWDLTTAMGTRANRLSISPGRAARPPAGRGPPVRPIRPGRGRAGAEPPSRILQGHDAA